MSPARSTIRGARGARAAIGALLAGLLLTGCVTTGSSSGGDDPGFVSGDRSITVVPPAERQPAPTLRGPQLGGDDQVDSARYVGQVLVVNVWGSWCVPCRVEADDLQAASEQTADVAQFLGLNTKDYSPAAAEAFVRVAGVTYPQIFDPGGTVLVSLAGNLPPNAIPTTMVIDKQNRIAARIAGTVTTSTLVSLINDIAAGR